MKNFSENEWGLVLAGGGGKGAYQIGVLKALEEKGILDCVSKISGASVGALNMLLIAGGTVENAERIWRNISPEKFIDIDPELIDLKEGFTSRDGVLDIINNDIDMDYVRYCDKKLFAVATEYDENGLGEGVASYFSLNYQSKENIINIVLASSALPKVYEPVRIGEKIYRDGGLKDNIPVKPLYDDGIRHFIVVGLSPNSGVNEDLYPDAEFFMIKPRESIGDFVDGTLDFSAKGARRRMEIGYIDAIREIEFSDVDKKSENGKILYGIKCESDQRQIDFNLKYSDLQEQLSDSMAKIQKLIE